MKSILKYSLVAVLFLFLQCSSSSSLTTGDDDDSGNTEQTTPTLSSSLKLSSDATDSSDAAFQAAAGQILPEGLTSLKYYILSINICESLETTGTAFSNPENCIELYTGTSNADLDYELDDDFAIYADVARGIEDGYIDLLDDTSRASLDTNLTLTSDHVGSYNYGYITWYLPIKVTAEINMDDTSIFRTLDGTTETDDVRGSPVTTADGDFDTNDTASEAVVVLANGGSWFKFQNAFEISDADITAGTAFELDLTFNPDGIIKAYTSEVGGCGECILQDTSGNQMLVPMLALTPIPHRDTESVSIETYSASLASGSDNLDLRLELYSIADDTDRTIYGVNALTLINDLSTSAVASFPKVAFLETETDETLTFQDYLGVDGPLISNFSRQTTVGESFSATIHCSTGDGGFRLDGCEDTTMDVTFTLDSISILE